MSGPTLFEYRKIPNEDHTAYTLQVLNDRREVVLTVPQVRPIHVQAVLRDDVAQRLIDKGYEDPQFSEGL